MNLFSSLFLIPVLFAFNFAPCLDANQEELFSLYQNVKQINNLY